MPNDFEQLILYFKYTDGAKESYSLVVEEKSNDDKDNRSKKDAFISVTIEDIKDYEANHEPTFRSVCMEIGKIEVNLCYNYNANYTAIAQFQHGVLQAKTPDSFRGFW